MTEAKMKKQDVITFRKKKGQKILKITFYKILPKC